MAEVQKRQISITRALSIIKSLKTELANMAKSNVSYTGIAIGKEGKTTSTVGMDSAQLTSHLRSNFDKYKSALSRYTQYKQAINKSNAVTMVTVNNVEMTVADAIILKSTLAEREAFIAHLKKSQTTANTSFREANNKFDELTRVLHENIVDKTKPEEEKASAFENFREQRFQANGPYLVDPNNMNERIEELEKEYQFLKSELDYVLSTSNTTTTIEVDA